MDPDTVNRNPEPEDEELLRAFARRYFPEGEGPTLMLKACMFTNTPDRHFILDRHPAHPEVSIAAGFSGHGYKFCSVIGEVMADLVQDERGRHDIEFFRLGQVRRGSRHSASPGALSQAHGRTRTRRREDESRGLTGVSHRVGDELSVAASRRTHTNVPRRFTGRGASR